MELDKENVQGPSATNDTATNQPPNRRQLRSNSTITNQATPPKPNKSTQKDETQAEPNTTKETQINPNSTKESSKTKKGETQINPNSTKESSKTKKGETKINPSSPTKETNKSKDGEKQTIPDNSAQKSKETSKTQKADTQSEPNNTNEISDTQKKTNTNGKVSIICMTDKRHVVQPDPDDNELFSPIIQEDDKLVFETKTVPIKNNSKSERQLINALDQLQQDYEKLEIQNIKQEEQIKSLNNDVKEKDKEIEELKDRMVQIDDQKRRNCRQNI